MATAAMALRDAQRALTERGYAATPQAANRIINDDADAEARAPGADRKVDAVLLRAAGRIVFDSLCGR